MDEPQQEKRKSLNRTRSLINFCQGVASTLFIIASTIAIYLFLLYRTRLQPLTNYAIVFDAGSSHTEMFVYHWPADKSDGIGNTSTVNELFVCALAAVHAEVPNKNGEKIKLKAISDFEQHLDLLSNYFRPCLNTAKDRIPSERHKYSPIFLGATAGMRLARLKNETNANQILETIRELFSHYPFQFVAARQVRILTGMEEAIDGWITTNLILEKFKQRQTQSKISDSLGKVNEHTHQMVGVLDLGGASTQVTFTHVNQEKDEPIPVNFTTNITLFETIYRPYAQSYLCWGKNEALRRHRARLLNIALNSNRNSSTTFLVRDPCLARGTNETVSQSYLFNSPCTVNEKNRFNSSSSSSSAVSFVFVGAGNASQCRHRLLNLFESKRNDKELKCSYKREYCTFDHTFQPPLASELHFIGLSGYYYVFQNLAHGMKKQTNRSTDRYHIADFPRKEIDRRLINVCETEYSILFQQESMTRENEQHKRNLCFDAWYMWLLLRHGIGFNDTDLERVSFANKFPTGKVGWTLGYMINQTNYIPAEYREKLIGKQLFISGFTVCLSVLAMALIFLVFTCKSYVRKFFTQRPDEVVRSKKDGYVRPVEQSIA